MTGAIDTAITIDFVLSGAARRSAIHGIPIPKFVSWCGRPRLRPSEIEGTPAT